MTERERSWDPAEARRSASPAPLAELESVARELTKLVTERAGQAGLVLQNGKSECLYHDGEIRVADVVGTFDENRFAHDGQQVSKEMLRQYHRHTQSGWVEAVSAAKDRATRERIADWRGLCEQQPAPLATDVVETARDLYCAGTNAYIDRQAFDAPAIDEAVAAARELT